MNNKLECYITLSWKGQSGTNTLAYWALRKLRIKQSVVNAAPGACIIKLITAVIYGFLNKLECFFLVSVYNLV
jgi:hypothetical protein